MLKFILMCSLAFAVEPAFLKLRNLKDASFIEIKKKTDELKVFVLFQDKCSACRKQIKELRCLESEASVVLVGVFSPEKALRQEFRRFKTKLNGVYGDSIFRDYVNLKMELTPQTFFQIKGRLYSLFGLKTCDQLLKVVGELKEADLKAD